MRDKPESCLRPFLFFFFLKHGKQIFYVILVRNKILSSIPFAQLFFSYDKYGIMYLMRIFTLSCHSVVKLIT